MAGRKKKARRVAGSRDRDRQPPAASAAQPVHGAAAPASATDAVAVAIAERPHQGMPAVLAIALLVAVTYFPALQGGFVWDDVIFSESR